LRLLINFPLGEGGLRGIDKKRKMVKKGYGERVDLKHPPIPPSKEGGTVKYFPLEKKELKGIDNYFSLSVFCFLPTNINIIFSFS